MKILFTGASSFTGYWFAKALAEDGHEVICTYTATGANAYNDVRAERVQRLQTLVKPVFGMCFGDERFIQLIQAERFDLFCHHAADVTNYKAADFDVTAALANNTSNIYPTLSALAESGCKNIVLTGSVFEGGEGAGSQGLPHFSPYGLSKSLTAQVFEYYAERFGLGFGKFVIPNPFGVFEEPRFTAYLMKAWLKGDAPKVNTPDYIRDNIHVGLLALYYRFFCNEMGRDGLRKLAPSDIACSQGMFTKQLSSEVSARLNIPCDFELAKQVDFSEPFMRLNTDRIQAITDSFSVSNAWDEFVAYYTGKYAVSG